MIFFKKVATFSIIIRNFAASFKNMVGSVAQLD